MPLDSAVGAGIFIVEVEGTLDFVVFVDEAVGFVEDDDVGEGGAGGGGVAVSDAVGGIEVDEVAETGLGHRLGANLGVDDSAAEGYLVLLGTTCQQQAPSQ